ncbi:MAG TPA: hypothetical protein VND19_04685 [Acetobacteraceae bacterium]|nr:hypothetical protein [Acetobacteraceae bacterium]
MSGTNKPLKTDIQTYCDYIAEVRPRLDVIQDFIDGKATTGLEPCNVEFIFLQFRKILELIAFASLTANKDAYSAAHAKFAQHWKAKSMLGELAKVNPRFYPDPLNPPRETAPGFKHFECPADGFMTISEFAILYDAASDLMHTRNPFTTKDPGINIVYSVQGWVSRIRRLLGWHTMHLLSGDKWIVNMPPEGIIQAFPASPMPDADLP